MIPASLPPQDQQRVERLSELIRRTLSGGCKVLSKRAACECPLCDLDYLLSRVEHAATDAARIAQLEVRAKGAEDCVVAVGLSLIGTGYESISISEAVKRVRESAYTAREALRAIADSSPESYPDAGSQTRAVQAIARAALTGAPCPR